MKIVFGMMVPYFCFVLGAMLWAEPALKELSFGQQWGLGMMFLVITIIMFCVSLIASQIGRYDD